jgi:hypothetical protein
MKGTNVLPLHYAKLLVFILHERQYSSLVCEGQEKCQSFLLQSMDLNLQESLQLID